MWGGGGGEASPSNFKGFEETETDSNVAKLLLCLPICGEENVATLRGSVLSVFHNKEQNTQKKQTF